MKKFILVYNPVSGSAKFKYRLDEFIHAFQERQSLLIPYRTAPRDNTGLLKLLDAVQADGIIIAGGDGTLSQTVNLLLTAGIRLPTGIIGSGTSNDFASYLGLKANLSAYADAVIEGKHRYIDVGKIGSRYFINVACAGVMTSIAHEVNAKLKNSLGKLAYYLKGLEELPKMKSVPLVVTCDGTEYRLNVLLFVIINSAVVGSMKNVAAARIDDGKLDFIAIKKAGLAGLIKIMGDLLQGNRVTERDDVLYLQGRTFTVASTGGTLISDIDGEQGPPLPLTVEAIPRALAIFSTP